MLFSVTYTYLMPWNDLQFVTRNPSGTRPHHQPCVPTACCLQTCAFNTGAQLQVVHPNLSNFTSQQPISVGLAGDHQTLNASLAVALARAWEQHTVNKQIGSSSSGGGGTSIDSSSTSSSSTVSHGVVRVEEGKEASAEQQQQQQQQEQQQLKNAAARLHQLQEGVLPEVYCQGLRTARWPGRSQVCKNTASTM